MAEIAQALRVLEWLVVALFVCLASVGDGQDVDDEDVVVDFVDDAPVADPDAPFQLTAGEFLCTRRAGIPAERIDGGDDAVTDLGIKLADLFAGSRQHHNGISHDYRPWASSSRSSALTCSQGIGSPPSARAA